MDLLDLKLSVRTVANNLYEAVDCLVKLMPLLGDTELQKIESETTCLCGDIPFKAWNILDARTEQPTPPESP